MILIGGRGSRSSTRARVNFNLFAFAIYIWLLRVISAANRCI